MNKPDMSNKRIDMSEHSMSMYASKEDMQKAVDQEELATLRAKAAAFDFLSKGDDEHLVILINDSGHTVMQRHSNLSEDQGHTLLEACNKAMEATQK